MGTTIKELYGQNNDMKLRGLKTKAVLAFACFVIIVIKEILINYLELIPPRSILNRSISWFGVLPLMVIGVIMAVLVTHDNIVKSRKMGKRTFDINLLLCLPILLFFLYFIFSIVYALLYAM